MRVKCVYRYSNKIVWVYKARVAGYALESYKLIQHTKPDDVNLINETNELFNLDLLMTYAYTSIKSRIGLDKLF